MRKVYLSEWLERYDIACNLNLILTIEYLVKKRKEIDEKGYFYELV